MLPVQGSQVPVSQAQVLVASQEGMSAVLALLGQAWQVRVLAVSRVGMSAALVLQVQASQAQVLAVSRVGMSAVQVWVVTASQVQTLAESQAGTSAVQVSAGAGRCWCRRCRCRVLVDVPALGRSAGDWCCRRS